jgi:ferric-dicitrate binding protein FerR (iron transport regulator)
MMKSTDRPDCKLVQELLLKRAREQRLSAEESRLVQAHAAACPDCGEEARLFGLLSFRSDPDSPLAPEEEKRKNQVAAAAADAFMAGRRGGQSPATTAFVLRRWAPAAAAAAAVLLIVAAYLLIVRQAGQPAASLAVTQVVGDAREGVSLLSTGAVVDTGDRLTTGAGAFLALSGGEGCFLFLLDGTNVVVGKQGEAVREFELGRGVLVARAGGGRTSCNLAVRAGDVTVVNRGTVFSVERSGDERIVSVVEGKVVVTSAAGKEWTVRAGEKLSIGQAGSSITPLTPREADVVRNAADGRFAPASGEAAAPEQVEKPGTAPPTGTGIEEGEKADSKKEHHAAAGAMDVSGLLKKARQLRKDKDWDGAAKIFGKIISEHPDSGEARIAVISLGEIYLENKADPAKALTCFNAYKAANPGGSLFKEASYGAIRCYRKLGQSTKEAGEIEKFLAQFPDDIYSEKLSRRLEELQVEKTEQPSK